ncbi:MAG: di-heme enzyme [Bacteroidetes bacterium]|nr:di-heme enzyme [Bacteroidota bacterium]MCB9043140.1 di-heme enzyme [Chitinophagales bacterium]
MPQKLKYGMLLLFAVVLACKGNLPQNTASSNLPTLPENEAALGRYFFFDKRLSYRQMTSCASCHAPQFAFTDSYRRSLTFSTERVRRNSSSLVNVGNYHYFTWANLQLTEIEQQLRHPFFINIPLEMGSIKDTTAILHTLAEDAFYQESIANLFPQKTMSWQIIFRCLAAYCRALNSYNAPYDKFVQTNDSSLLSSDALEGMALFFADSIACAKCHAGNNFSIAATEQATPENAFANIGLYNVDMLNEYPNLDKGVIMITNNPDDDGRFRIPMLRNLLFTAPYFHDGSVETLNEVIDIHAQGGRNIKYGPLKGNGIVNECKDPRLQTFIISENEKRYIAAFLYALTDSSILHNPFFKMPDYFAQKPTDNNSYYE